jgi:glycosyltransferase involved in cell wall biosynthesis
MNSNQKKRILCAAHGSILGATGGVEIYQRLIDEHLSDHFEFLYFSPNLEAKSKNQYFLYRANGEIIESYACSQPVSQELISHEELEIYFLSILKKWRIDLIHFHHFLRLCPTLAKLATDAKIPYVISIHDFYFICDEYNLLDATGTYCNIFNRNQEECDSCLLEIRGFQPGSQMMRRKAFAAILQGAECIFFNTARARLDFEKIFPLLTKKETQVIGAPSTTRFKKFSKMPSEGKIEILIPGGLTRIKGADTLIELFENLDSDRFTFHVLGKCENPYSKMNLSKRFPHVHFYGKYTREDLERISLGLHISLHLSIVPESFCISLSETWDLGLIPIVSDLGALGERVQNEVNGFKVTPGDSSASIAILNQVFEDRALLSGIEGRLHESLSVSPERCASVHLEVYQTLLKHQLQENLLTEWLNLPISWVTRKKNCKQLSILGLFSKLYK